METENTLYQEITSPKKKSNQRTHKKKEDYLIKCICNALDILEAFTEGEEELGVTELGKRLNLHKNNVFRILATLEHRGYIEQNNITENYRLGLKPLELGKAFQKNCVLTAQTKEILKELVLACNETSSIGVYSKGKVIYIDTEETTRSVRVASRLGTVLPIHCTSIGKSLLAFRREDEIYTFLKKGPLHRYTPRTITDTEILLHQFDQIRRQGYAIDHEEFEESVTCIAVPVRDHTQNVVAALSISGPTHRFPVSRIQGDLVPLLKNTGRTLSKRLGYHKR